MNADPPTAATILAGLAANHPHLVPLLGPVQAAAALIVTSQRAGGWVFTCGNGGSAADADHIVGEFMKGFLLPRPPPAADLVRLAALDPAWAGLAPKLQRGVRAMSLAAHGPLATAILNDQDAQLIFAQQVYAAVRPGDVVIGLSTSGNSANVLRAVQVARTLGARTIAFTGAAPGALDACEVVVKAPVTGTARVQECHLPLYHALCALVEVELFPPT